jgi:hypothetical protein
MEKRKTCPVAWCEATHENDHSDIEIRHHYAGIRHHLNTDRTVTSVMAFWAERLDGRRGVDAHVTVMDDGDGDHRVDLIPSEANAWAALLTTAGEPGWLAEALREGAQLLTPYEDHEHDGQPHYVADDASSRIDAPAKVAATVERTYPLPRPDDDPKFNIGLLADVIRVLETHGYPAIHQGRDIVRLQQALYGFLYGEDER